MKIGDKVVRKSYGKDITFKIIDIKENEIGFIYVLKGVNLRIIADSPESDLEYVTKTDVGKKDEVFNKKVNENIRRILNSRIAGRQYRSMDNNRNIDNNRSNKYIKEEKKNSETMLFGRPGRILHIDGDAEYLDVCLKTYKQLAMEASGYVIPEEEQPHKVLEIVKQLKPDIVVLTGHDAMVKGAKNYMDLDNYKNSKNFVQSVINLRNYEANYDDLVIFAGACQSCYEAILDAGANFASSPNRVLIHCLDPVFICEKIAYTNISKIVSIQEIIASTITGVEGIGGLQTRGKYREGFPKSKYS
ncbi:sporulation peptidase YabG [Clostridium brassicae]|uniref:Sporulation peptidase YabG n=1 Tax=Clostridium brassicae TaxID=2999072 RepID=A0ABT4DBY9_9CLOT|nr:sporulation peptidase YabG [Clostridium brassicae]MCY6958746.1 sporulation peptidase YabG [Clostridium brassicae]